MSKTHLCIAGHGILADNTFDPGATGVITKGEHKYMKEDLFPAIKRHLPKDHNIVFFDSYSVVSRGNLASLVKQYDADQVTEFHYDAAVAAASGGHVIIHTDYSPDKTDLALRDAIKNMVGVRYSHKGYEGISGRADLGNVKIARNNGITYRLVELGFGTNKRDADIMVNQVDEYAKQIVKAITGKVSSSPSKPKADPKPAPKPKTKSISQLADEVIAGQHGTGAERKKSLGSQYEAVQKAVNEKLLGSKPKKSTRQMAQEVIDGKHGNGHVNRRRSLGINATEYNKVKDIVNGRLQRGNATKSVTRMATEVIQGKHGSGHKARRESLGISKSKYEEVRKEVNRRM